MAELKGKIEVEVKEMSSVKGMTTCKVCGRDFPLLAEEHYIAQDPQKIGAIASIVNTDRAFEFDAFDCPHCGCQNVTQNRKPVYLGNDVCPCDYGICDECDHPGEPTENPKDNGCNNCRYADKDEDAEPCVSCSHRYVDRYTKGENSDE